MKKLIFLLVPFFLFAVMTGCDAATESVEEETTEEVMTEEDTTVLYESFTDIDAEVTLPESDMFSWYRTPFLRATYVTPLRNELYRGAVYSYTSTEYGYHPTEYVAYYIGDRCGIADSSGNILCDALYTDPLYCPASDSAAFDNHSLVYTPEKSEVSASAEHGGGPAILYYDLNSERYICISGSQGDNDTVLYDKQGVYIVREAYMDLISRNEFSDTYRIKETGKIGLYKNQRLVIPFEYVAAAEISDGIVAMYDGSMWTYFTVYGKVIMENVSVIDTMLSYYEIIRSEEGVMIDTKWNDINIVYSYSESSVPVKKDGKWGYMDKKGNMIIDAVFDNALPFFEGRAWVCVDGYWGIINIE